MTKEQKVGLATNIGVAIIIVIVGAYLGHRAYNAGIEAGYKKGRIAGWNEGYEEARQTMMSFVLEAVKGSSSKADTGSVERQLHDIESKIDRAEMERRLEGAK